MIQFEEVTGAPLLVTVRDLGDASFVIEPSVNLTILPVKTVLAAYSDKDEKILSATDREMTKFFLKYEKYNITRVVEGVKPVLHFYKRFGTVARM